MSGGSEKKMLTLRSTDGKLFDIEVEAATMSVMIHNLIEGVVGEAPIPVPNVNGDILAKVTEYLRKHVEAEAKIREAGPGSSSSDGGVGDACRKLWKELKEWDAEFITDVSQDVLFAIVLGGSEKKMFTLRSTDGKLFDIEVEAAAMLVMIHNLIEDGVVGEAPIPVPNVNGNILAKVTKYLRKHVEAEAKIRDAGPGSSNSDGGAGDACRGLRKKLKEWDAEFIVDVSQDVLFDIVLAANYLDIKPLLDLSCQKVSDLIKDKSPEEVRELFGMENDFTP